MENNDLNQDKNQDITKEEIYLGVLRELKTKIENAILALGGDKDAVSKIKRVETDNTGGRVLEGVFAGDKMIGSDGESYSIPPNYASKSKLVEGDIMKLTVSTGGNFIYKQIKPTERKRMIGELLVDQEQDEYWVLSDTDKWRVLKASITYFKGQSGDKVAFLVPSDAPSKWAAVENIVKGDEAL